MLLIQHHNIDHVKSGSVDVEGGRGQEMTTKLERERERESRDVDERKGKSNDPEPEEINHFHAFAYFPVQSLALANAALRFVFHTSAISFANGSSGFGVLISAWIDKRTCRI